MGWAEGLKTGRERVGVLTILGCPVALTTTKEGDAMKNAVVQGTLVPGDLIHACLILDFREGGGTRILSLCLACMLPDACSRGCLQA